MDKAESRNLEDFKAFLDSPRNSRTRELIFTHRLIHDIQVAAAMNRYHFSVYQPEVDRDKYDLILDNQEVSRKIQVKSVLSSSGTTQWSIGKGILRPNFRIAEYMETFANSAEGIGVFGAVILVEATLTGFKSNPINFCYYYTDLLTVLAFRLKIIFRNNSTSQKAIDKLFRNIFTGFGGETVSVPKGAFVKVRFPESLLALLGFYTQSCTNFWVRSMLLATNYDIGGRSKKLYAPVDYHKNIVVSELKKFLSEDENISFFES